MLMPLVLQRSLKRFISSISAGLAEQADTVSGRDFVRIRLIAHGLVPDSILSALQSQNVDRMPFTHGQ